ncbi:MAG: vacuolar family H+-ATPase subunit H [Lachnospiraceae bacterium]|jgi:cell division septum initiation protein DivIVA|nr:vacuolar family H+-ATPase subunit H [Lachnospiraceae bacterium]
MSSRIEQIIDEIETYIERCKYQPLSSTKIIVVKEEIDELIRELRMKTPDEIKRYQKIITNKEAILNEAKRKAQELVEAATIQTNELINEHEIMQQAYAQANEVVDLATRQAQEILDTATIEANDYRGAAMQYTDEILANMEILVGRITQTAQTHCESFMNQMNMYGDEIAGNRMQLFPPEAELVEESIEVVNIEANDKDVGISVM